MECLIGRFIYQTFKCVCFFFFFCLRICKCTMYVPGAPGGERAWDTLELELPHIVVSHRVGSGTQTQVPRKGNTSSWLLSLLSGPYFIILWDKLLCSWGCSQARHVAKDDLNSRSSRLYLPSTGITGPCRALSLQNSILSGEFQKHTKAEQHNEPPGPRYQRQPPPTRSQSHFISTPTPLPLPLQGLKEPADSTEPHLFKR